MVTDGITTVFVRDMDRAVHFYTQVLGARLEYQSPHWSQVTTGSGVKIGLHPQSETGAAGPRGSIEIGFFVDRPIEQAVKELQSRGVTFDGPIKDDGGAVRLAFFADPDGNPLYLCEMQS